MATHSRILAWRIPRTEGPGEESDTTEQLTLTRSEVSQKEKNKYHIFYASMQNLEKWHR